MGSVAPRLLFLSPREHARGPSALACLGKTGWKMSPRGVSLGGPSALARHGMTPRDAVPNEVRTPSRAQARGALLSLGRTKKALGRAK